MHPAFSVIFLTTLIGAGQGLLLALFTAESYAALALLPPQSPTFYTFGALIALALLAGGLLASVFHLGKPSYFVTRAWRAATQWRTSWLSREIIALPITMLLVAIYALLHFSGWDPQLIASGPVHGQITLLAGTLASLAVIALFIATGMIYAAIRFIQEWATPLTVVNYLLLGSASGFTLATAYSSWQAPALTGFYASWALLITLVAALSRGAALYRNGRIKRLSTPQSAIGVRHPQIRQQAMGMMGGAFNTREFFHHRGRLLLRSIRWLFLLLAFALPLPLIWLGSTNHDTTLLLSAFVVQYLGLLLERWFFFAQANHPQNLYYQVV